MTFIIKTTCLQASFTNVIKTIYSIINQSAYLYECIRSYKRTYPRTKLTKATLRKEIHSISSFQYLQIRFFWACSRLWLQWYSSTCGHECLELSADIDEEVGTNTAQCFFMYFWHWKFLMSKVHNKNDRLLFVRFQLYLF